jgi:hypothetical protein
MRAKKITLLLFLTAISLLTIFLVVLLDDTVLAADDPNTLLLQNVNLSNVPSGGMVVIKPSISETRFLRDELKPLKAV